MCGGRTVHLTPNIFLIIKIYPRTIFLESIKICILGKSNFNEKYIPKDKEKHAKILVKF